MLRKAAKSPSAQTRARARKRKHAGPPSETLHAGKSRRRDGTAPSPTIDDQGAAVQARATDHRRPAENRGLPPPMGLADLGASTAMRPSVQIRSPSGPPSPRRRFPPPETTPPRAESACREDRPFSRRSSGETPAPTGREPPTRHANRPAHSHDSRTNSQVVPLSSGGEIPSYGIYWPCRPKAKMCLPHGLRLRRPGKPPLADAGAARATVHPRIEPGVAAFSVTQALWLHNR